MVLVARRTCARKQCRAGAAASLPPMELNDPSYTKDVITRISTPHKLIQL